MKRKVNKYQFGGITPNGVKFPWEYADQQYVQAVTPIEPNASSSFTPISDTMRNVFSTSQSYHQNPLTRSISFGGNGFGNFIKGLDNSQLNAGISGIGNLATNAISSANQKYSTVSDARKATAMNTISGAVSGAAAGAMIGGPIGAVVGGAAGLASGLVGGKSKARDASFYEDPTLEYGTGILGFIGRGSARRKYNELKKKAEGNRIAAMTGQEANADWMYDLDSENNVFAANGGDIGDLAWLDDGELFKTPDQQIYSVPEQGKPEDSNLLSIPDGTKVLSDKLKVPGTKETFANMAKRLTSKKSRYTDKYAQGSAEANAINDKQVFDTLFNIQESIKGGKKEYKAGLQEFQKGGGKNLPEVEITAKRPSNVLQEVIVNGVDLRDDNLRINGIPVPDQIKGNYVRLIQLLKNDPKNIVAISAEADNIRRKLIQSKLPSSITRQWDNMLKSYETGLGVNNTTMQQQMIPDSTRLHLANNIASPVSNDVINDIQQNARFATLNSFVTDPYAFGESNVPGIGPVYNTGDQSLRIYPYDGTKFPLSSDEYAKKDFSWDIFSTAPVGSLFGGSGGFNMTQFPNTVRSNNTDDSLPGTTIISEQNDRTSTNPVTTIASKPTYRRKLKLSLADIQVPEAGQPEGILTPKKVNIHDIAYDYLTKKPEQPKQTNVIPITSILVTPKRRLDLGQIATDIAALYGPVMDLNTKPETFMPTFNPYEGAALDLMGRRRYDIRPTVDALRRANASQNYAASQYNTNTGANLAFRLQNALKMNSAISEAYANQALQNNQYAAEYANSLDAFGQQRAQALDNSMMRNAQSRAQARNIERNARNAIGQYAQLRRRNYNQAQHDAAMLDLYKPFLDAGFRVEDYSKLISQYGR